MSKRQQFDLQVEIARAWDWCWNYYCTPQIYQEEEYDRNGMPTGKKSGLERTLPARQQWLTATDLERRVRAACAEALEGKPYGSYGADAWGSRVRISALSSSTRGHTLLEACREWLRDKAYSGKLTCHNFGRGHCSGARYRPAGQGLTESEKETITRKEKRKDAPVHFADTEGRRNSYFAPALCTRAARATVRAKYKGYSRGNTRSHTRVTREADKVTCPRCLKLLQLQKTVTG